MRTAEPTGSIILTSSPSYTLSLSGLASSPLGHIIPLPSVIACALPSDTVTNGLANSGLSICGGIHRPRSYALIVHESIVRFSSSPSTPFAHNSSNTSRSVRGSASTASSLCTRFPCVKVPYCNISLDCARLAHFSGASAYVFPSNSPRRPRASCSAIQRSHASRASRETLAGKSVAPRRAARARASRSRSSRTRSSSSTASEDMRG